MERLMGLALAAAFAATAGFTTIPKNAGTPETPAVKQQPVTPAPLRIAPYTKTNSRKE